jgi:hypothetical protein
MRTGAVAAVILCTSVLARHAAAQALFTFRAPHVVRAPVARLDPSRGKDALIPSRNGLGFSRVALKMVGPLALGPSAPRLVP